MRRQMRALIGVEFDYDTALGAGLKVMMQQYFRQLG